jgi:hypothetical protein
MCREVWQLLQCTAVTKFVIPSLATMRSIPVVSCLLGSNTVACIVSRLFVCVDKACAVAVVLGSTAVPLGSTCGDACDDLWVILVRVRVPCALPSELDAPSAVAFLNSIL